MCTHKHTHTHIHHGHYDKKKQKYSLPFLHHGNRYISSAFLITFSQGKHKRAKTKIGVLKLDF